MNSQDTHIIERESQLTKDLYIVATPIGNLKDMTFRAVEVLKSVDAILCEDTRTSSKLLSAYSIHTPKIAYHEHNEAEMLAKIVRMIKVEGKKLALISDAGMPLVSDPGYKLVRECDKEEISVTCIPGASATVTALALSALPTDKFMFAGFLPNKSSARKKSLLEVKEIKPTIIFYETANRLQESLEDILEVLGDRTISVARELTKKFEEVRKGKISELIDYYRENGSPKGEIVLVIEGFDESSIEVSQDEIDKLILDALGDGKMRVKEASSYVAEKLGLKKSDVYARALELKDK